MRIKIEPQTTHLTQSHSPTSPTIRMPGLNTKIYVMSKGNIQEQTTVRDAISLGQGKAYEVVKGLDCFEELYAEFMEEIISDTPYEYHHTLDSKIYVLTKEGIREETTVRDAISLGQGKVYEVVKDMMADQ